VSENSDRLVSAVVISGMADQDLVARLADYRRLEHLISVLKADRVMVFFTSEGVLFARDSSPQGWLFAKDGDAWKAKMVPMPG